VNGYGCPLFVKLVSCKSLIRGFLSNQSFLWYVYAHHLLVFDVTIQKVFQMFNNKLNERVVVSQKGGSGVCLPSRRLVVNPLTLCVREQGPSPVIHRHFKERDVFYSDGIRVSLNEQGEVLRKGSRPFPFFNYSRRLTLILHKCERSV